MDPLIELLHNNSRRSPAELARLLGITESEVAARIAAAEADGTILGYSAVVDRLKAGHRGVTALIEVRITPERDGGFDRLAKRIAKFDQVRECFLMSGGYDLAVSEFVRVSGTLLPRRMFERICPEILAGSRTAAGTPVASRASRAPSVRSRAVASSS